MPLRSVDPATGEVVAEHAEHTAGEVEGAVAGAHAAFGSWARTAPAARAERLRALAGVLRDRREALASIATREMGKPIGEARAEVDKCAWACEFYAVNGPRLLADERVETDARESLVAYEPLGVVLAVMPWNFPHWQVVRAAAPILMAGNALLLKHASNVPGCALAIEDAVRAAGFPDGLFRTLLLSGGAVEPLIDDPRVRGVTLTGSSETGARIGELAGRSIKKVVLELGGSDPFIVLADADLAAAATTAARARNQNSGQSCIAAKRFIVESAAAGEFERLFADAIRALRVGDPADERTQVGPLAREDLRDALERQVRESVRQGARVVVGGRRVERPGWFYEPTLLADVTLDMPVMREETFGPVAALFAVRDAEEAVRVANATPYGLGAALWTRDLAAAKALARRIESGQVFVNGMVASDPRLPFGGVKRSGIGRELSHFGLREFTNVQTIWIGDPSPAASATPASE